MSSTTSGSSVIELDPAREREDKFLKLMDCLIGETVNECYMITEYVCHGQTAGIMEGSCTRTGRKIVLKLSRPDDHSIIHEIRVMRQLGWSPYIPQMLAWSLNGIHVRYFVCIQEKQSLWKHYLQNGAFDLQQSLIVAHDVFRGLQFLHQNKIVHRDLHPGNLVISSDEATAIKLIDFGQSGIRINEEDYESVVDQTQCNPVFFSPLSVLQGEESVEADDLHQAMLGLLKLRDSPITRLSLSEFNAMKLELVRNCSAALPLEEEVLADVLTQVFEAQRYEPCGLVAKFPDHDALIRSVQSIHGFNPDTKF